MSDDGVFRILFVCTGNICRSPVAERLTAHGLRVRLGDDADRFDVRSAGTWGYTGSPMEEHAATALREHGAEPDGFRARELEPDMVRQSDLVLAATREHRAAVVTLHPRAAAHTFTIREFDRLLAPVGPAGLPTDDPAERAAAVVRSAAANRGLVPAVDPRLDDVPDPYGAPLQAFRNMAATVAAALERPLDLLGG